MGKPKPSVLCQTNGGKDWVPYTVPELEAWIGILLIMGVKKELQIHNYWQYNKEVLRDSMIPWVMSLNRWEAINRCIHLVDHRTVETNSSTPRYDILAKTHWLIEYFKRRSKEVNNLEPMIAVDELVVLYIRKYARIQQFMKDKLHHFGLKIWAMYSSRLRFVLSVEVYKGAGTGLRDHRLGYHITMRLLQGYKKYGHTVIVDNFFASVRLF